MGALLSIPLLLVPSMGTVRYLYHRQYSNANEPSTARHLRRQLLRSRHLLSRMLCLRCIQVQVG